MEITEIKIGHFTIKQYYDGILVLNDDEVIISLSEAKHHCNCSDKVNEPIKINCGPNYKLKNLSKSKNNIEIIEVE